MKFICLGYIDESAFAKLSADEGQRMVEGCIGYDDELRRGGHFLGGEALGDSSSAVTLQFRNGKVQVTDGPFAETREVLGGILLLEARDMQHAVELMSRHPGVKVGPFEIRPADEKINQMIAERDQAFRNQSTNSDDEAQIRKLIEEWSRSLEAKDITSLLKNYSPDIVLYDATPPYKTEGLENVRARWESCLPYFPEQFRSEHRDLKINVSGELAVVHGLHHFVPDPPDHPCGTSWMRITVVYRKTGGRWKVIHEHVSLPYNPMNNSVWQITDPDRLDQPDYAAMAGGSEG